MSAVEGLSGVIARMNALCRGRSQPGTHEGDFRPAMQQSSQRISISVIAALTDLVSCCAPAALFTEEGKGKVAMRATRYLFQTEGIIRAADGGFVPRISSSIGGCDRGSTGMS